MATFLTRFRRWILPQLHLVLVGSVFGGLAVYCFFGFNGSENLSSRSSFDRGFLSPDFQNSDGDQPLQGFDSAGLIRSRKGLRSKYVYFNQTVPLIWIGGVPRSGTTLMRAMLDAHNDVRCGEETRVIPRLLSMNSGMQKSNLEMTRLKEAHIDRNVLHRALGAYILSIITDHGDLAPRLCNKDPFTLRSMQILREIFPNSKFIFMIRDGRATVHSIITRKVTIKGFDVKSYKGGLTDWNRAIKAMNDECTKAGPAHCLRVHYEQLVLHPEKEMRRILDFLELPWDEKVIHHEQTIGKKGGISLSQRELSTDQVNKPVNLGALISWVNDFPEDAKESVRSVAPMLQDLGYDPNAYPPKYGMPDEIVLRNSDAISTKKYLAVMDS